MSVTFKFKSKKEPIRFYRFGPEVDGSASMKDVLGGKGANLAEMASLGVPVPPGFTIPCSASVRYQKVSKLPVSSTSFEKELTLVIESGMDYLREVSGMTPLVSVRSGARVSMPGMMDTILNVGLTEGTLDEWRGILGDRAALDSYRRLLQMYGSVACGIEMVKFDSVLEDTKEMFGVTLDSEMTAYHLGTLVSRYLDVYESEKVKVPSTMEEQLYGAVTSVFKSWNNPRAIEYRRIHGYPDSWGTAVNIQSMVFGNTGDKSCTGVLFSRNPSNGEGKITGEWLPNAQGEDVVAGIRTPYDLSDIWEWNPKAANQLVTLVEMLEKHYKDMQDVEFTVQDGNLYILQTRNGKRSPLAAFSIAHDLVEEGLINKEEAVSRVNRGQLMSVMQDTIDPAYTVEPNVTGIAAGGGLVTGKAVFSSSDAVNCTEPCILIRKETDPNDIEGMNKAVGILTSTGGLTSHAAVVARGLNKSCVVGTTGLNVSNGTATVIDEANAVTISSGDKVTIDGSTGKVWIGVEVPIISGAINQKVRGILKWAAGESVERMTPQFGQSKKEMSDLFNQVVTDACYVDTALLEGANREETTKAMVTLQEAMGSFQGSQVTLDLSGVNSHYVESDKTYDKVFGFTESDYQEVEKTKLEALVPWSGSAKVVIRSESLTKDEATKVKELGYLVETTVSTVADLLEATGPVEVPEAVIESVFGGKEAFYTVKSMIEGETGVSLSGTTVFEPRYWYEFLGESK